MKRILMWVGCTLAICFLVAGTTTLHACPFCLAPLQTWSEVVRDADVVCLAKLISADAGEDGGTASAVLQVTKSHKGRQFAGGQTIHVKQYVYGKPGDLFLMTGQLKVPESRTLVETFATDADGNAVAGSETDRGQGPIPTKDDARQKPTIRQVSATDSERTDVESAARKVLTWNHIEATSDTVYDYIVSAPKMDVDDRLTYFVPFLEHAEPQIAADAWGEFANADYEIICKLRTEFDSQKLRQWITQADTSPERLGLYGMMLGLCGNQDDAAFLRRQILNGSSDELRFGIEGLMGGLLLITKEQGLAFLEQQLITRSDVTGAESLAVIQALQFAWTYEPDLIAKDRLRSALHPYLQKSSVRELVIRNMARWNDWSGLEKLPPLFEVAAADRDSGTQRAIIGYLLTCRKNESAEESLQQRADSVLEEIRTAEPRLVRMMERDMR
ncbi:MAG: hypothetical protein NXI04_04305 [Planctomycetaceae bacterium]|nr:hypothetical protein [Planctomycetaceae bacterium]